MFNVSPTEHVYHFLLRKHKFFCFNFTDLSHNRITKITINAFGHLSNLTTLDLSYNKLLKLQPDTVRPLRHLKTLNISGNSQIDMYDIRHTFNVSVAIIYNTILKDVQPSTEQIQIRYIAHFTFHIYNAIK